MRIGIIAGQGKLPLSIGESLTTRGYNVCFFCIKNFASTSEYKDYENIEINITSFGKILTSLNKKKIDKIIMVGKIARPTIKDMKFDLATLGIIKNYLLESKGDDKLLKIISNFFLNNGYPLFEWKNACEDLFSTKDHLTLLRPSKNALKNKDKGLEVFKLVGKSDIGQSIVVQNQLILGVECLEGTDELIKRCDKYKKLGDLNILLKLSKYDQHNQLDLPTIGINTLKILKKYNYEGLFIEKNKCIIIDKKKVINFCNKNNLFLSTVNKLD